MLVGRQGVHQSEVVKQCGLLQAIRHKYVLEHDVGPEDFARARVGKARTVSTKGRKGARGPSQHVVAHVAGVPRCRIGLNLYRDGILESGLLKGLVPGLSGALDDGAKLEWCGVLNPPGNGLHWLADCSLGVFLYQAPSVDHVAVVRGLGARHIVDLLAEVAYAGVVASRNKFRRRHCQNTVLQANGHVARVGHVGAAAHGVRVVVHEVDNHVGVFGVRTKFNHARLGLAQ